MEVWLYFLAWTLVNIFVGINIGKWIATNFSKYNKDYNSDLAKIVNRVKNRDNEDRINNLILYHNKRVKAGANSKVSLSRLIKDIERLEQEEKTNDEDRDPV